MSNSFNQNSNLTDLKSQITTTISSNSNYKDSSNLKLLKHKRGRNKNDKHEYNNLINQYYIEDYFDCYHIDSYDHSEKSSSEYQKEDINFVKLKNDLMPK